MEKHTRKSHPAFTPKPQRINTLWLVLIFRPREGRRLSWPGWMLHTKSELVCRPKTVTHPSTNRPIVLRLESNSRPLSRKSDALTTTDYRAWYTIPSVRCSLSAIACLTHARMGLVTQYFTDTGSKTHSGVIGYWLPLSAADMTATVH